MQSSNANDDDNVLFSDKDDDTPITESPAKSLNVNGKRQMSLSQALFRAMRKTTHQISAVTILEDWHQNKREETYAKTLWSAQVILLDIILVKIAANGRLQTVADLEAAFDPPWILAVEHGGKILALLAQLDLCECNIHKCLLQTNREAKCLWQQAQEEEEQKKQQEEMYKAEAKKHC